MADGDKKVVCCVLLLLTGAVGQGPRVDYQHPLCAVKGSTLTILCSFTPQSVNTDGKQVLVEIIRVVWCKNHEICQLTTPSVYDSELQNKRVNNPRYRYLGDKKGNCSLQITGVQDGDNGTFRFRMEANDAANHYTGRSGATVRVSDGAQMEVHSSTHRAFKRGEAITLNCTTKCTFHQLEVTWLRDGHALKHTGPSLHLAALTAGDSGNYTCRLKNDVSSFSKAFSVHVEAEEEGGVQVSLIVSVVSSVLMLLCFVIVVLAIIRKKNQSAVRGEAGPEVKGAQQQEEDVSYAHIQFKARGGQARPVKVEDDSIIYSSVVA
uniref:Ig-like domain-containing protein n=1 Tax=Gasterosteus aculeatus aculeatus TaxID=481459 RepID=A0AAQ4RFK7_GASAC|nr:uncharacterized protein LOC120811023 isoform X1 [Gasterosteus aculeatus aculeatus]